MLYEFLIRSLRAVYPTHLYFLHFITLRTFVNHTMYESLHNSQSNSLQQPVTSCLSGRNKFFPSSQVFRYPESTLKVTHDLNLAITVNANDCSVCWYQRCGYEEHGTHPRLLAGKDVWEVLLAKDVSHILLNKFPDIYIEFIPVKIIMHKNKAYLKQFWNVLTV
jgi:hypothetical protein